MTDPQLLDQAFHRLMRSLVESGRALHYAELAREMGLAVEEGRQLLLAVMMAAPGHGLHCVLPAPQQSADAISRDRAR
jgi:uncharacterized protein YfbU (UPF0304 family)